MKRQFGSQVATRRRSLDPTHMSVRALPPGLSTDVLWRAMVTAVNSFDEISEIPSWLRRALASRNPIRLRRLLDDRRRRDELPRQLSLYNALYRVRRNSWVHERLIQPALVAREGRNQTRVFLDPAIFSNLVVKARSELDVTDAVAANSDLEQLLICAYAFALLQTSQADEILAPLRSLGIGVGFWLGDQPEAEVSAMDSEVKAALPAASPAALVPTSESEYSTVSKPPATAARVVTGDPCTSEAVSAMGEQFDQVDRLAGSLLGMVPKLDGSEQREREMSANLQQLGRGLVAGTTQLRAFADCPTDCVGANEGCAPLRAHAGQSNVRLEQVRDFAQHARGVRRRQHELSDRAHEARVQAEVFANDLGQALAEQSELFDSLRSAATHEREMSLELARLRETHTRHLSDERDRVLAGSQELSSLATDPTHLATLEALISGVRTASTLATLSRLAGELDYLRTTLRALRPADQLAAEALHSRGSSRTSADGVAALALALGDRPMLAATLLWMFQQIEAYDDALADADVHGFWDAFLRTLSALPSNLHLRTVLALVEPGGWLLHASLSDLPESARIPLSFLVLAAAHRKPSLRALAQKLGSASTAESTGLPTLVRVVRSIVSNEQIAIVDGVADPIMAARTQVESLLRSALSGFVRQANNNPRAKGEAELVREALRSAWNAVRNAQTPDVAREWRIVETAIEKIDGRHYQLNAENDCDELRDEIEKYVEARGSRSNGILRGELQAELERLKASSGPFAPLLDHAFGLICAEPSHDSADFVALALTSGEVGRHAPGVLVAMSRELDWVPSDRDMVTLLQAIASPLSPQDAKEYLSENGCYLAADAIALSSSNPIGHTSSSALREAELKKRLDSLGDQISLDEQSKLQRGFASRRFGYVIQLIERLEHRFAEYLREAANAAQEALKHRRTICRDLEDRVAEERCDEEWRRCFGAELSRINSHIGRMIAPDRTGQEKRAALERLDECLRLAQSVLELKYHDFAPLRGAVGELIDESRAIEDSDDLARPSNLTKGQLRDECWQEFLRFQKNPRDREKNRTLLKSFTKLVNLYMKEPEPESAALPTLTTLFQKPGARYFETPVKLHLIPPAPDNAREIAQILEDIERDLTDPTHHIALAADDSPVAPLTKSSGRDGRVTILLRKDIKRIAESKAAGGPLRKAMRRYVSVASTSPFKSEGHVDERQAYVSRTNAVSQLVKGVSAALWGGRRSGKTSLLHEVKRRFESLRDERWTAVYISLEGHRKTPLDRLDLAVARDLARKMEWPAPDSVDDFIDALTKTCREHNVCLLVDETDAYVRPHLDANSTDYSLIRKLRGVSDRVASQEHNRGQLICVFAGFKDLFQVIRIDRHHRDSSYPWQNWLKNLNPLSYLSSEETEQLLRDGFEELLGLELEPKVTLQIFQYTGGHPAAVQYFADCLLRGIADSVKSDPSRCVTLDDVRRTFDDDRTRDGQHAFVLFVESTLDMNLEELEKIIVYVMAASSTPGRDGRMMWATSEIESEVTWYFVNSQSEPPTKTEYDRAFKTLEMTGMLTMENYKVGLTFPYYADILRRLEEANKTRISELIAKYKRGMA